MEKPDMAILARRYLDLWEQQIVAGVTGTAGIAAAEAAEIMAQVLSGGALTGKGGREGGATATGRAATEPGTTHIGPAALGPASVHGDGQHDEFARRLAQCAERFATLAAGIDGGGGSDGGSEAL
jgi:hypothetical protein